MIIETASLVLYVLVCANTWCVSSIEFPGIVVDLSAHWRGSIQLWKECLPCVKAGTSLGVELLWHTSSFKSDSMSSANAIYISGAHDFIAIQLWFAPITAAVHLCAWTNSLLEQPVIALVLKVINQPKEYKYYPLWNWTVKTQKKVLIRFDVIYRKYKRRFNGVLQAHGVTYILTWQHPYGILISLIVRMPWVTGEKYRTTSDLNQHTNRVQSAPGTVALTVHNE